MSICYCTYWLNLLLLVYLHTRIIEEIYKHHCFITLCFIKIFQKLVQNALMQCQPEICWSELPDSCLALTRAYQQSISDLTNFLLAILKSFYFNHFLNVCVRLLYYFLHLLNLRLLVLLP